MSDDIDFSSPLERHVAGATVTHESPFSQLEVPVAYDVSATLVQWSGPLYLRFPSEEARTFLREHLHEVDTTLVASLLTTLNWRTRIAGAYYVALREMHDFEDWLGKLLLRSDVCFAGEGYSLALAMLSSDRSVEYLKTYLRYYLAQPHLYFDQGSALAALMHIDKLRGTNHHQEHLSAWSDFVHDKPNWKLDGEIARFNERIDFINIVRSESQFYWKP